MGRRTRLGLVGAMALVASCVQAPQGPPAAPGVGASAPSTNPPPGQAGAPATAVPTATASLPPLDDPGANPYRAPDFTVLPREAEGGRWERIAVTAQPTAPPTPTPAPTPTRFPGEPEGYAPIYLPQPQDLALVVGETTRLQAHADGPQLAGPATWGVVEADRASITADGTLTALAPGPVHVWVEFGGARRYLLVAIAAPDVGAREAMPGAYWPHYDHHGTWGTFLRSEADWQAFQARFAPQAPASPPAVDFARETLVVVRVATTDDGERPPVVTRIRRDGGTVVEVVAPDLPPGICSCDPHVLTTVVAVPRLPEDAALELVRLRSIERLALSPAGGPPPTPEPTPYQGPSPDPFDLLPPGSPPRPAMPPYPPPTLPREGGCPDAALFNGAYQAPLFLAWLDAPTTEPRAWEPVLTPGAALRLFATNYKGDLRWTSADPRIADVAADGTVTGRRAGSAVVTAEVPAGRVRALVPVIDALAPAARFRFRADWATPNDQAKRGPRIIRDAAAWEALWRDDLFYDLPWAPPAVDFARHDVVALVDDRLASAEAEPVVTHVSDSGATVHVAFPGIEAGGASYRRTIHLFLTGKLAPDAKVRVHTLCDPAGR